MIQSLEHRLQTHEQGNPIGWRLADDARRQERGSRRELLRSGSAFIVALVGVDGCGKTTQARRLAAWLTRSGTPALYVLNSGGRGWLGRFGKRFGRTRAEQRLGVGGLLVVESVLRGLAIARSLLCAHLRRRPAVMDRYSVCQYVSIRAHRGQGLPLGPYERLIRWAYRFFPRPAMTFLLDIEPAEAYRRIEARGTDHETLEFLIAASRAYRELPEAGDFVVIDANPAPDAVTDAICAALIRRRRYLWLNGSREGLG